MVGPHNDPSIIETVLPHSEFGNPECCGCLTATIITDTAVIACNECGAVVKMVPAGEIHEALAQFETQIDTAMSTCPHCVLAYICPACGRGVDLSA